jgi:hypothetical protein
VCPSDTIADACYVLARFLGRFARSIATNSFVCRVSVKEITDPQNHYLTDHPMASLEVDSRLLVINRLLQDLFFEESTFVG